MNNVLGTYGIGACWCGPSYFVDPVDSVARVVSSGGRVVRVWKVNLSPTPSLSLVASSVSIGGGQDPGFFTSISSNGTSNPIIWALSRPSSTDLSIYLYAFNPDSGTTMKTLFTGPAGTWPNLGGNANLVPVVANGQVLVASHNQLEIFGLTGTVTDTAVTSNPNPSAYGGCSDAYRDCESQDDRDADGNGGISRRHDDTGHGDAECWERQLHDCNAKRGSSLHQGRV